MQHFELDSVSLYDAFVSGGKEIIEKREEINKINVFPVADGDTGTNLAMTMRSLIERSAPMSTAGGTMRSMADASLSGARGNSGMILAQFFMGLSESMGDLATVSSEAFSKAAKNAERRARESVLSPVEGTILTVIKDWAKALEDNQRLRDFDQIFQEALKEAKRSLDNTPNLLSVLKKEHVVDAGAEGFFFFLAGATKHLVSGANERVPGHPDGLVDLPPSVHGGEFPVHRYCTEALIRGKGIDLLRLRAELGFWGDCGIAAGNGEKARVHVHTDAPAAVMKKLSGYGALLEQKVDDMLREYEAAHSRKYPIALVTDSVCDLPKALVDEYQIHVVPLNIAMRGEQYLDGLTISSEDVYESMESRGAYPTSSQPSPSAFETLYSFLSTYYESIIAIHVSGKLSGTYSLSVSEAAKFPDKKITVLDSRNDSGSQALIVLRAAELIAEGKSHEEIVAAVESFTLKARIFVAVPTLRYMVRGGRVSPLKGMIASLFNLKPIVSLDLEGGSMLCGRAFSKRRSLLRIVDLAMAFIGEGKLRYYGVVHAGNLVEAREFAARLEQATGRKPLFIQEISTVIALNAGRDTVAAVLMKE